MNTLTNEEYMYIVQQHSDKHKKVHKLYELNNQHDFVNNVYLLTSSMDFTYNIQKIHFVSNYMVADKPEHW